MIFRKPTFGLLLVLLGFFSASAEAHAFGFGDFFGHTTSFFAHIKERIASELAPSAPSFYQDIKAEVTGNGEGINSMVLYFKTVNGVALGDSTCPAGWTSAMKGFGPHYVGVIGFDWQDESGDDLWGYIPGRPSTTTEREPKDPPPPPEPEGPTTGGGSTPPEDGGGEGGDGGEDKPEKPQPDNITPGPGPYDKDDSPPVPGPGKGPDDLPFLLKDNKAFALIPRARAQAVGNYFITAVGIGSDSVCSDSNNHVVPVQTIYNNGLQPVRDRMYSMACYTDPQSGITECNRCRICVK